MCQARYGERSFWDNFFKKPLAVLFWHFHMFFPSKQQKTTEFISGFIPNRQLCRKLLIYLLLAKITGNQTAFDVGARSR